jgi:hypothetical protein
MENYLTSALKNSQHTVFLDTPKWLFTSGPGPFGVMQNTRQNRTNSAVLPRGILGALQTNVVKSLQKALIFYAPQKVLETHL